MKKGQSGYGSNKGQGLGMGVLRVCALVPENYTTDNTKRVDYKTNKPTIYKAH